MGGTLIRKPCQQRGYVSLMMGIYFGATTSPTLKETAFECQLPLLPVLFQRDMFGLDVGDVGVGVKCITDSDDVRLIFLGVLDDGFRRNLCVYGDDGAKQAIGFLWTWGCPPQRTKEIVVNDGAVEIRVLKML